MAICKHCSGELTQRSYKSKREGELLFECFGCGEKWQGHTRYGYLHLYQVKVKSGLETKSIVKTARVKPSKLGELQEKGGMQAIVDRELGQ